MPAGGDTAGLAGRLHRVAGNLAAGRRETPQRLIPLAAAIARSGEARLRLVRFLLAAALAEAEGDASCSPAVFDLLRRTSAAVARCEPTNVTPLQEVGAEVLAAAPRLHRRRSIHCHGQVASDRRLLLLRAVLDDSEAWSHDGGWYTLWLAAAYAMSDYDHDHFVMLGPLVAARIGRLARWVEATRPSMPRIERAATLRD